MKLLRAAVFALLCLLTLPFARASSVLPLTTAQQVAGADAVCRGTVMAMTGFRRSDGLIYTRTSVSVAEPLKGIFPATLQVIHRGGIVDDRDELYDASPEFRLGGEYVLFLSRRADGTLFCFQGPGSAERLHRVAGTNQLDAAAVRLLTDVRRLTDNGRLAGADVSDQVGESGAALDSVTASGLIDDGGGISSRFLAGDRGETITYYIDADNYPAGITFTQATNAVAQAFAAWAAVTKLKFQFGGIQSFGTNADALNYSDETIRIQLHDNYNTINSATTLAVGGRAAILSPLPTAGWDLGGNVNGSEFHKSVMGYVVMERTNSLFTGSVLTFTEVLCHEIGHSLSMAHSSETAAEPNATLKQAIMYYAAHADGRGATLGAYDPPIIQKAYPTNNTPPYCYARVMDVVDAPVQPVISGVNEVEVRGYDLQSTNLTLLITNGTTTNGVFTQVVNKVKFTPSIYGSGSRVDPAGNGYYDFVCARISDGTNASPYVRVKAISLSGDSVATSDGIPDNWMIYYFGNANPATGVNHRATNDLDGDGLNNLKEFIAGTSPTNSVSAQRVTLLSTNAVAFQAKAYELYEIYSSTDLVNWARCGNPILPTNASAADRVDLFATNITATASNLPVTGARTFFRVQKVP